MHVKNQFKLHYSSYFQKIYKKYHTMHAFYHRRSISLQKKIKNDPNLLFSYNYYLIILQVSEQYFTKGSPKNMSEAK